MIQANEMQMTDGTEQCFYVLLKSCFAFLSLHILHIIQLTHTFLTKHLKPSTYCITTTNYTNYQYAEETAGCKLPMSGAET